MIPLMERTLLDYKPEGARGFLSMGRPTAAQRRVLDVHEGLHLSLQDISLALLSLAFTPTRLIYGWERREDFSVPMMYVMFDNFGAINLIGMIGMNQSLGSRNEPALGKLQTGRIIPFSDRRLTERFDSPLIPADH